MEASLSPPFLAGMLRLPAKEPMRHHPFLSQ